MLIQQNNLRLYRKQSQLTQSDIAFLMDLSDYSNISHWELGYKKPNIDILIIYHLLFDIPIESLFDRQKQELSESISKRIEGLLGMLKSTPEDDKVTNRIAFLTSALNRLTA
jgi:transcriptional regulator with XRE-family HTH domain